MCLILGNGAEGEGLMLVPMQLLSFVVTAEEDGPESDRGRCSHRCTQVHIEIGQQARVAACNRRADGFPSTYLGPGLQPTGLCGVAGGNLTKVAQGALEKPVCGVLGPEISVDPRGVPSLRAGSSPIRESNGLALLGDPKWHVVCPSAAGTET